MLSASINAGVGRSRSPHNAKVGPAPGHAQTGDSSSSGLMPLLARYLNRKYAMQYFVTSRKNVNI